MFRLREVIIRLLLEHFKRNIQIALLEMRSRFLHNAFIVNVCTYVCMYVYNDRSLAQSPSFGFVHRLIFLTNPTFR